MNAIRLISRVLQISEETNGCKDGANDNDDEDDEFSVVVDLSPIELRLRACEQRYGIYTYISYFIQ